MSMFYKFDKTLYKVFKCRRILTMSATIFCKYL